MEQFSEHAFDWFVSYGPWAIGWLVAVFEAIAIGWLILRFLNHNRENQKVLLTVAESLGSVQAAMVAHREQIQHTIEAQGALLLKTIEVLLWKSKATTGQ